MSLWSELCTKTKAKIAKKYFNVSNSGALVINNDLILSEKLKTGESTMSILEELGVFNIPEWALPYLVDGDNTGLEDGELMMVDEWVVNQFPDHNCLVFSTNDEVCEFSTNPAFGLPTSIIETTILGHRK